MRRLTDRSVAAALLWLVVLAGAPRGAPALDHLLTVSCPRPALGTVSSTPAGLSCATSCNAFFGSGSVVTLAAVPDPGSRFVRWGGDCAGTGDCTVTMDGPKTAFALFEPVTEPYSVLHHFAPGLHDGRSPYYADPVSDGTFLYGVTQDGGLATLGVVFRVRQDGSDFMVLHEFVAGSSDGKWPRAPLTLDGGVLFGTTNMGGSALYGTVFRLNTDGTGFQILANFNRINGAMPFGKLLLDGDSVYGTTAYGGSQNKGTVFRVAKDGSSPLQVLRSFTGGASDGDCPYGGVVLEGGRLYGTTTAGGSSGAGAVFSVNPDGTDFQIVHSFTGEPGGRRPEGTLIAVGGVLYGTTVYGGAGVGTVFSVMPDGSLFQVLHEFPASFIEGQNPRCTLVSSAGTLFGTTTAGGGGNGNVFRVDLDGSDFAVLHTFTWGPDDGSAPHGSVILDAGTLYGMTLYGGADEAGVLYRLDTSGGSFEVLREFQGGARDGKSPWATPVLVGGVLYGTTFYGGDDDEGAVVGIDPDGSDPRVVHSFSGTDGNHPTGALVSDGTWLFGITRTGGSSDRGVVFRARVDGAAFEVLHDFVSPEGSYGYGPLTLAGGVLYGATYGGGTSDLGTLFKVNTDGTGFAVIRSFAGGTADGRNPYGGMVSDGTWLYGTTETGGASDQGTLFRIRPSGNDFSILRSFSSSTGRNPRGCLLRSGSTLYGTTSAGGSSSGGVVFRVSTSGSSYQVLHSFVGSDGSMPGYGLALVSGKLYGTTSSGGSYSNGTLYSVSSYGGSFQALRSFRGLSPDGRTPQGVVADAAGVLYGMTTNAGVAESGVVFSMRTWVTLSGQVTLEGAGLPGVLMEGLPGASPVYTDDTGHFTASVPLGWSGTVTPVRWCHVFAPASTSYTSLGSDQLSQDYTAALAPPTWYRDEDGDWYGNPLISRVSCDWEEGWVDINGDCNDQDPSVHPGAEELCDGKDNDCDLTVDEPVFAGATGAYSSSSGSCWVRLQWDAATACAGPAVYNVYSSAYPDPPALRERCVTQLWFVDTEVEPDTYYYYQVRAENPASGGGGPCFGGAEDDNGVIYGVYPTGCTAAAPDVLFLTSRSADLGVRLEWLNPASGYGMNRVCWKTTGYPTGPTNGTCVDVVVDPGPYGTTVHDATSPGGIANATRYYYGVWVNSDPGGTGAWSGGRFTTGRPFDTSGPVKWAYTTGATALAPAAIGSVFDASNDRGLHSMRPGSGPEGGTWPSEWSPFRMNGPSQSRPTVIPLELVAGVEKVVYLGSQDGSVYAVDALTGGQVWSSYDANGDRDLGEAVQGAVSGMFTAYGGTVDRLFVGTRNASSPNVLHALDPATGVIVDSFDNGGGAGSIGIISGQPLVDYANGRVYFASRAGGSSATVWCLPADRFAGPPSPLWATPVGDVDGGPSQSGDHATVYVGTNASHVVALDAATGAVRWDHALSVADGIVKGYVAVDYTSNRLYLTTENRVWGLADDGTSAVEMFSLQPPAIGGSLSMPLYARGGGRQYLWVGSGNGRLYQLDLSGDPANPVVSSQILGDGGSAVGAPALDRTTNIVHVGTDAGAVYAVAVPF